MADKKMYFGTREHMKWVKCPNSGLGMTRSGWSANGTYLNGGGWSRSSVTTHFEPSLTWSFLDHRGVREIQDFYFGAYGPGPFYWLDPFAMGTNVLPVHWSIPRLAAEDAPSLVRDRRPTLSTTGANLLDLPSQTATYEAREGDQMHTLWVPIPEDFTLHVAAWGSSTGTARLTVGEVDVALTPIHAEEPTWTAITGVPGAEFSLAGVGFVSLTGVVAQVLPVSVSPSLRTRDAAYNPFGRNDSTTPKFLSGAGHSGCVFKSPPVPVGYSAPQALDYQSLTADFIEVGAWLS